MFIHSEKVPELYKLSAKILKDIVENGFSIKECVYSRSRKFSNTKAMYSLVVNTLENFSKINYLIEKSELFKKEPRFDPWMARILIMELWTKRALKSTCKPVQTILSYKTVLEKHFSVVVNEVNAKITKGDLAVNAPLIPEHTKQAVKAIALLLFYSVLMFTLPFVSFFGTKYTLEDKFNIVGYTNTVWSVIAAVATVNIIIVMYAYHAYHDTEYDDEGNEITIGQLFKPKTD